MERTVPYGRLAAPVSISHGPKTGGGTFRILDLRAESCLVEATGGAPAMLVLQTSTGCGDKQIARCLLVLAGPEGEHLRFAFKRRTAARVVPPEDFAR